NPAPANMPPQAFYPAQPVNKTNKTPVAVLIIAAVVMTIAIISIALFLVFGRNSGDNFSDGTVRHSYAEFVSKSVKKDIGVFSVNSAKKKSDGIYSVLVKDLDGDNSEECVVAYKKKSGKKLKYGVTCYHSRKNQNVTVNDIEEVDSCDSYEEPDYIVTDSNEYEESRMYSVDYNGEVYIIEEHLNAYEGFMFNAYVYSYSDGEFKQVSNFRYDSLFPDGYCAMSSALPEGLKVDNSDIDIDELKKTDEFIAEKISSGNTLLYYDSQNEGFTYNSKYSSETEAIDAFYSCYGVTRGVPVITDPFCSLNMNEPIGAYNLYHYTYDPSNSDQVIEFEDYTNSNDFLNIQDDTASSTTKQVTSANLPNPNIGKLVKQSAAAEAAKEHNVGTFAIHSYGIYTKVSDTQYKIVFYMVGERFGSQEDTYNLYYKNGKWEFDTPLDWEINTGFTVMSENDNRAPRVKALYEYYKKMESLCQEYSIYSNEDMTGLEYHLFDIDGDDMPELIYHTGSYQKEFEYHVYTYKNGKLVNLGILEGIHKNLSTDGQGRLCLEQIYKAYQFEYLIEIVNGKVDTTDTLFEGQYGDRGGDEFEYLEGQTEYEYPAEFIYSVAPVD
ncbi:MAG: hypothetical protein IJ643_00715, partial [Eubacterium sp.]|nr:hypothetical protein [Eubacterium sp.]